VSESPNCTTYTPERLAYWYFRLNGFLTIENFIVHPDIGSDQRTDADILAVRFAHRAENLSTPMQDDPKVASCERFANVIIAEVKTGTCALNTSWTDPSKENMERALKAIGCVPGSAFDAAYTALYTKGFWSDPAATLRIFVLGECKEETLTIPLNQQLIWGEIVDSCIKRFKSYEPQKRSVGQWTEDGRQLKDAALSDDPEQQIRRLFGLHHSSTVTQQVSLPQ